MTSQASRVASFRRLILRIAGTVVGAGIALMLTGTVAYDHVLCAVSLFAISFLGILGFLLAPYGYAWLLSAITALMVILSSLQDPSSAFTFAANRAAEVMTGTVTAVLAAVLLAPPEAPAPGSETGFTELFGSNWPAVLQAVRGGIAITLIPFVWAALDLPSMTQMAVTVVAVMGATPAGDYGDPTIFIRRAVLRIMGCLFGGIAGLILLAMPLSDLFPWLVALTVGVYVCMHVQNTTLGHGYIGTQAAIVYIMTMVQGNGPPLSILPGAERLAGVTGGLTILLIVSLAVWPAPPAAERA